MNIKVDSYAVESNVHFPTDINLLWDSVRKCFDIIGFVKQDFDLPGWRKLNFWQSQIKYKFRTTSNIHRKKGTNYKERLKKAVIPFLDDCQTILLKLDASIEWLETTHPNNIASNQAIISIQLFKPMLEKHIDLVRRRLVNREVIPHAEKVFSIFEPYTEWLQKGKRNNQVELGLNVSIASCNYGFILTHIVMVKQKDVQIAQLIAQDIYDSYNELNNLLSISFDRGYYSITNKANISKLINKVILPKKGKKNEKEKQVESEEEFVELRKKHSAIESNINELENHGVNKCPDKGLPNFKRYISLGIISYNLTKLGRIILGDKTQKSKAA